MEVQSAPSVMQSQKNLFEFVQGQLAADPVQSKKFLMAGAGVLAIVVCFIVSALLFFHRADLAPHLVSMFTILCPTIGGLVGIYLGAQGAVEVKANGVLQKQAQDIANKL
jgi:hypothetical protein